MIKKLILREGRDDGGEIYLTTKILFPEVYAKVLPGWQNSCHPVHQEKAFRCGQVQISLYGGQQLL